MVNLMKVKMNIPKILDFWNYFIKKYVEYVGLSVSACVANIILRLFTFASRLPPRQMNILPNYIE